MNQRTLRDIEEYVELAFSAASEARKAVRDLEARVEILEDGARVSRIDPEFEARVLAAIERHHSSRPPANQLDVKTSGGTRLRGGLAIVLVITLASLLFAAIWRVEELAKALK